VKATRAEAIALVFDAIKLRATNAPPTIVKQQELSTLHLNPSIFFRQWFSCDYSDSIRFRCMVQFECIVSILEMGSI
jgi:hypothetical protein